MYRKIKILLGVMFVFGFIYIPAVSFADSQIGIQDSDINVEVTPDSPKPYDDVYINLTSYATDLSKASITWQNEKGTVLSGIGKTTYSFKVGGPDTNTIINISIKPTDSLTNITKTINVGVSLVDLIWQSVDGYTPLFYKGKSLPTKGSLIRVVAIPSTSTIKSGVGNISYSWSNNDSAVQDASGYNKNAYTFTDNLYSNDNSVTVTASSVNGSYNAKNTVDIPIYNSKIIFYKKSPTEGILYNNALTDGFSFGEDELTLVAEPYFLTTKDTTDKFNYNWMINGNSITTPSKKTELTIRPTSRGGYALISATFESVNKLFQKISGQLKINL